MTEIKMGGIQYVVIICEDALEHKIGREIIDAGAKGYTVSTVRGRGNRGVRDAQSALSSNARFEIVCPRNVALKIVQSIESKFSQNYGLVACMMDALAVRSEEY